MAWASLCSFFNFFTVSRSAAVLAWKIISKCCFKTERAESARGPLPRKMTLVIGEEVLVVFYFGVVIDGFEVAFVIHFFPGAFVVSNVVDKENTV